MFFFPPLDTKRDFLLFSEHVVLTSPSGVSEGQSIPHCEGCRERGPLTFLVFSNWEEMRVIIPKAEMKERRESTCVTPCLSILNLFKDQFP